MIIGLKLSKTHVFTNKLLAYDIAKQIGVLAFSNDLGINYQLHPGIRPDIAPYLAEMNIEIKPIGNEPIREFAFELTAGSLGVCICNAIPNDSTEPDPDPENSGIYKFLDGLFKIKGIKNAIIYFGPFLIDKNHKLKQLIPKNNEKPNEFLYHFTTNDTEQIISIGTWGIYSIKL
jgi:hypothetical protein